MTVNGQDCSNKKIIVENFNTFLLVLGKRMNTTFTYMKSHTLAIIWLMISNVNLHSI